MLAGIEWLIDAAGCFPDRLQSVDCVRKICGQIIFDLELTVVQDPAWHKFPGAGGVTGIYLLSESHLACHTYPECGLATFNLYCCRERPDWDWSGRLKIELGACEVRVQSVPRGTVIRPACPGLSPAEVRR